jgi:hypothetical protein
MPLVNMKMPARAEKMASCAPCDVAREEYPYGLRLHLDTEQLAQLGIDKLPDVGAEVTITARGKITSVNQGASEHDKKVFRNVGIQITDLSLGGGKADKKRTEDVLYKDEKSGEG